MNKLQKLLYKQEFIATLIITLLIANIALVCFNITQHYIQAFTNDGEEISVQQKELLRGLMANQEMIYRCVKAGTCP